ncbi:MAG: hypothetical protein LBU23_07425, partial [Planctomycetota bacterium]|nr:hypothetical protein [Planctomycetota bacterium]
MPYRKIAGRWTVRRQVRRVCRDKGEALKYNALIESALAKAEQELDQGSKGCCSIHGKLAEFLADSKAGMGRGPDCDKTLALHRKRLGVFDRAFRQRPLDAIGRDELERWMRRRLAGGVLPDTVNADVGALKAFARWARKKHYAPEFLPLLNVERMQSRGKLPGKNRKPPVALEIGELKRRLRRLRQEREDVGLFLGCMALLGLRPAEVAALRREDYRPPRGGDCGR